MDFEEFSGKNIEDAITEACTKFTVTSDRLDYEIIDRGSAGFLGLNSHPAIIKAKPAAAKGQYLKSVSLTTTMGPGLRINTTKM